MNDKTQAAYNEMSKAEYEYDDARRKLELTKKDYNEAKMNECIENILKVQEEDGKLTERSLKIFIGDFLSWVRK